jgi:hypothetical protein
LDSNMDSSEHCDERSHEVEHIVDENEFWGTKFEDLVLSKGPQQILQLILQEQVDEFNEKKIINLNNYVN